MSNPYQAPNRVADTSPDASYGTVAVVGQIAAGFLAALYLLVALASVYELANLARPSFAGGYIRHCIASCLFLLTSLLALFQFRRRSRAAFALLAVSTVLAVVFITPGLNEVWRLLSHL